MSLPYLHMASAFAASFSSTLIFLTSRFVWPTFRCLLRSSCVTQGWKQIGHWNKHFSRSFW